MAKYQLLTSLQFAGDDPPYPPPPYHLFISPAVVIMENNKEEKLKANAKAKMEEYKVIEKIGRGADWKRSVWSCMEKERYVSNKIRVSKQFEKFKRTAYHEMNLMAKLSNPCLVEYKDAWVDESVEKDFRYIIMKLDKSTSLTMTTSKMTSIRKMGDNV